MVSLPSFMLGRLYVKGSLKNADGGFEFQLRNILGAARAHRMSPLELDGAELPTESTYFILDGKEVAFSGVSKDSTFELQMNETITVWVDRVTIEPGPHKVEMEFDAPGMGTVRFDFTDIAAE